MKQYLVTFRAEYYCQGFEWSWFTKLVEAASFQAACDKIKGMDTAEWEKGTPELFKNETL